MSRIANPHKKFQFGLVFFGMNEMLAQKVTSPEFSFDKVEHGEGNHKIKTAGMINFSNIIVEKLDSATFPDKRFWNWVKDIQDAKTGKGLPPEMYKKNCQILRYNTFQAPIASWVCTGVWPEKINGVELDRISSDNTIETIELSVDIGDYK